jgi:L-2-hydroxyglutarate oxidase
LVCASGGAMTAERWDLIIVGGGIVGTATALAALQRAPGLRLLLLEKEDRLAAHQSGHNSGVIHSGIYYRPGSLKARTCVAGAAAMLEFCREHSLPCEVCGKVVVAAREQELPALEELRRQGEANGVAGISLLGREELREREPHCAGVGALRVPGTAIADYAAVTRKLSELAAAQGAEIRTGSRVTALAERGGEIVVRTTSGDFVASHLINCAGLYSDRVAEMAGTRVGVRIVPFRGEYYELAAARRDLVSSLIYPVPDPRFPFLGVHFTRRVSGAVEAGPNAVLAFRREGYRKRDLSLGESLSTFLYPGFWRLAGRYWRTAAGEFYRSWSRKAFVRELQRLVPEVRASDLEPGGAGVRAQAVARDGKLLDDFQFAFSPRMMHVCNVPSPAATASIVLGRIIVEEFVKACEQGLGSLAAAKSSEHP